MEAIDGNMYEIPRPVRCKNREKYMPKKNNYTQDRIYVVWQFAYIHRVVRILLFSKKNTKCGSTFFFFFFSLKNDIKTLVFKTTVLHPTHKIHNGLQKGPKQFPGCNGPSRSAHGKASKNLPLKTATILFWVGS